MIPAPLWPKLWGLVIVGGPPALVIVLGLPALVSWRLAEPTIGRWCIGTIIVGLCATLAGGWMLLVSQQAQLSLDLGNGLVLPDYHFRLSLILDDLSIPFAMLVYVLSGTIAVFATRYLHREPGYQRFFVCYAIFVWGMIWAALAGTIETLFTGWELVGLSSVMLVAFFQERPAPVRNALRLWCIYRLSDAALLLAAVVLHHQGIGAGEQLLSQGGWTTERAPYCETTDVAVGFLLLVAAAGKSALFPFSGWLPRAMEGPTPSSAIFYGALSVHLGVYLLLRVSRLRLFPVEVRAAMITLGLLTAVLAWLIARVQTDVKSAIAYAGLVQVGIIVVEIGLGWERLALVHLWGNACWRTLQFIRAPSLLHDYHQLRHALGHGWSAPSEPVLLPMTGMRLWLYRLALERAYLDQILDTWIVSPVVQVLRRCEAVERWWMTLLNGPPSVPPVPSEPAPLTFDDLP